MQVSKNASRLSDFKIRKSNGGDLFGVPALPFRCLRHESDLRPSAVTASLIFLPFAAPYNRILKSLTSATRNLSPHAAAAIFATIHELAGNANGGARKPHARSQTAPQRLQLDPDHLRRPPRRREANHQRPPRLVRYSPG